MKIMWMAGGRVGIVTKRFDSLSYNERMCTKYFPFYFLLHCSIQRYFILLLHLIDFKLYPQMCTPELRNGLIFAFHNLINILLLSAFIFPFWKKIVSFSSVPPIILLIILIASFWCFLLYYFFSPFQQLEF